VLSTTTNLAINIKIFISLCDVVLAPAVDGPAGAGVADAVCLAQVAGQRLVRRLINVYRWTGCCSGNGSANPARGVDEGIPGGPV
jgi:hypothetical protein